MKSGNTFVITIIAIISVVDSRNRNRGTTAAVFNFIREGTLFPKDEPPETKQILREYDFIIVGAGAAGCVVANRLTEVSTWNVLLIEAGGRESFVMDVPILASWMQFTEFNWNYKTVPNKKVCLSLQNQMCLHPRGKVMGGSSTINYMIYTRGNRRNYDLWEEMGNPGWGYKDVLPYFLKIENMTIPELAKDKKFHSTKGNLPISYAPFRTPLADSFVQGGIEMGYRNVDYNGETQTGFSYLQTNLNNGTRWSSSRAYLHPIKNRKNFHVKKRSLVTKILIDPYTKKAYGVEFVQNNKKYVARASKEVIVSGGAINSPQLLMLSGIGPKEHLTEKNIPVIQNLRVGYNLMDHPGLASATFLINESISLVTDELLMDGRNIVNYGFYHRGPFSVPAACEGIAFLDTRNPKSIDGDPDIELLFFGGGISSEVTYYKVLGYSDELYNAVYKPIQGLHSWLVVPLAIRPKSRGRIMLKSSNPFQRPLIHHNFFEHQEDMEKQLLAIKKMVELSKTPAFQKYGSRLHDIPIPGCKQFVFGSDEYWRCAARHTSIPIWHVSGTCKMGPSWDSSAVVNSRLKVYGIEGLRVIDASIMPMVPAAHINVPSMMIGERGADFIKQDWYITV